MKVSELNDAQLDYWVGSAADDSKEYVLSEWWRACFVRTTAERYSPSSDWSQGGPIIEREKISVINSGESGWHAHIFAKTGGWGGTTALIAAMRCYVASKFGDEVPDVPYA